MKRGLTFLFSFLLFFFFLTLSFLSLRPFLSSSPSSQNTGSSCPTQNLPEKEYLVTKVIDGDTFLIEGGHSIRLWGIDADEKDYPCYLTAKNSLEKLILNKRVYLKRVDKDRDVYCRFIRQAFVGGQDIALVLLREGEVVVRGGGEEYRRAEREARENKKGCKWQDLPEVLACQAQEWVGKRVRVVGRVVATKRVSRAIFLNLEKPYPQQCFTVVIFSRSFKNFPEPPEEKYYQKRIRVTGTVTLYKGKPEIIAEHPSQIEILD